MTQVFYHGTSALAAICIWADGFRLLSNNLRNWSNGALGNGIYVTAALDTASFFSSVAGSSRLRDPQYVLQVRMRPGARILRLNGQFDPGTIDYLKREFGKELLTPKFDRAIPANKHLTRVELIHLANYLWDRGEKGGGLAAWAGREDFGALRRTLVRSKYDGVGCTESDIGVVVFNPSRLVNDGVFQLADDTAAASGTISQMESGVRLIEPGWRELANMAAKELLATIKEIPRLRDSLATNEAGNFRDMAKWDREQLAAYQSEVPRRQTCLRRFCEQQGVSTTDSRIAPALKEIE
jgi:hypothetical protein